MRNEYDFSKGECGKFYRHNAKVHLPVYLDDDMQATLVTLTTANKRSALAGSLHGDTDLNALYLRWPGLLQHTPLPNGPSRNCQLVSHTPFATLKF